MSEGNKKNVKSFTPYVVQNYSSVDASIDPMRQFRPQIRVQTSNDPQALSTEQPFNMIFNPQLTTFDISQRVSFDGANEFLMNPSKFVGPFVNNSLDSKAIQKPFDVLHSQSRYITPMMSYFFASPHQSFIPFMTPDQRNSHTSLDKINKLPQMNSTHQSIITQQQPSNNQFHYRKEELKFIHNDNDDSECESLSQVIKVEESSCIQKKESEPQISKRLRKRIPIQESSDSYRANRKKKGPKVNDTKNITKNFSKAIISYILNNNELCLRFLSQEQLDSFLTLLKNKKNSMTNIKQLRDLWIDNGKNPDLNRAFRIISQYFLKNQAVSYVYNSRISNTAWHLKYRQNLLRALREPENFKFIKDI